MLQLLFNVNVTHTKQIKQLLQNSLGNSKMIIKWLSAAHNTQSFNFGTDTILETLLDKNVFLIITNHPSSWHWPHSNLPTGIFAKTRCNAPLGETTEFLYKWIPQCIVIFLYDKHLKLVCKVKCARRKFHRLQQQKAFYQPNASNAKQLAWAALK